MFLRVFRGCYNLDWSLDSEVKDQEGCGGPWTTRNMLTSRTTQIVYSVPNL